MKRKSSSIILIVVIVVALKDFLSKLLLSLVNVSIKLVSVLSNRELLVVINWNVDFLAAIWFIIRVVELSNVRVLQCLLCCWSFVWIELEQRSE